MHTPTNSGAVAALVQTTEPVLNDQIRRGKIVPPPPVVAGRRQWDLHHILQAARQLGRDEAEILAKLTEVTHAP